MKFPFNHPFMEVAEQMQSWINAGHRVHQKFTCANCGTRQAMAKPNLIYTTGRCEECSHVSDLTQDGCNFLLILNPTEKDLK